MAYISQYPPAQNTAYVKATSYQYSPWNATDPAKSVTGSWTNNSWISADGSYTNQRFHIDLGSAKAITRVYYENGHNSATGVYTHGAKAFTLWGSNTAAAFAQLTYATDTNWTQLTTDVSQFAIHPSNDNADPHYVAVTNSTPYRYYAFKFATNWGNGNFTGVRRIELQLEPSSGFLAFM